MIQTIRIDANIAWTALRDTRTDGWLAECPALRLTAEGETWEALNEMIYDIQAHLFLTLLREGTLPRFLREHGWATVGSPPSKRAAAGRVRFDIPATVFQSGSYACA